MQSSDLKTREEILRREVLGLVKIGVALADTRDLDELLELIVSEARAFTSADAGSLYLLEGDKLVYKVAQNQTLLDRLGVA